MFALLTSSKWLQVDFKMLDEVWICRFNQLSLNKVFWLEQPCYETNRCWRKTGKWGGRKTITEMLLPVFWLTSHLLQSRGLCQESALYNLQYIVWTWCEVLFLNDVILFLTFSDPPPLFILCHILVPPHPVPPIGWRNLWIAKWDCDKCTFASCNLLLGSTDSFRCSGT